MNETNRLTGNTQIDRGLRYQSPVQIGLMCIACSRVEAAPESSCCAACREIALDTDDHWYRPSSETERQAELAVRNHQRMSTFEYRLNIQRMEEINANF